MRSLKVQEMQEDSFVFKFGEIGESFYIVMSGTVQIVMPVPVKVVDNDTKPLELLKIVLENFDDIAWINIENGDTCRNLILKVLKEL